MTTVSLCFAAAFRRSCRIGSTKRNTTWTIKWRKPIKTSPVACSPAEFFKSAIRNT